MLCCKSVKLALKLVYFHSKRIDAVVSILFDLVDSYNLPLERLSLFEECLVHLLDLVTLHSILLLQCEILLESQFEMRLFTS